MTKQLIETAIANGLEVSFIYDGHPRIVTPVASGRHYQSGKASFRGFQSAGGSNSGRPTGWRMFTLADAHGVSLGGPAGLPAGYTRGDSHLSTIDVER